MRYNNKNTPKEILSYKLIRLKVRFNYVLKPKLKWNINYRLKYLLGIKLYAQVHGVIYKVVPLRHINNHCECIMKARATKGMYKSGLLFIVIPASELFDNPYDLTMYHINK